MHTIYCVGDSHSALWSGINLPEFREWGHGITVAKSHDNFFKVFHLGPCLAYSANKHGSTSRCLEKIELLINSGAIPQHSAIMVCLGEIDLRVHICKVEKCDRLQRIKNSVSSLLELMTMLKKLGYLPIGYGPIASQKDAWYQNPDYPRAGSEFERNSATQIFNELYKVGCEKLEVPFFSLFDRMIDENFHTDENFIYDECHMKASYFPVAEKLLLSCLKSYGLELTPLPHSIVPCLAERLKSIYNFLHGNKKSIFKRI